MIELGYHFPQHSPTRSGGAKHPHIKTMKTLYAKVVLIKFSEKIGRDMAVVTTAEHGTGSIVIESMTPEGKNHLMGLKSYRGNVFRNQSGVSLPVKLVEMQMGNDGNSYPRYEVLSDEEVAAEEVAEAKAKK
jgi:hypothetical protein